MNQENVPYLDDIDFDEQISRIQEADTATMLSLQSAIEDLNPSEKLAAAVLALHYYDRTDCNPLEFSIDGDYSLEEAIDLIGKLSPIGKIEFARWVLDEKEDELLGIGINSPQPKSNTEKPRPAEPEVQINPEYDPIPF
ncbi:MAG: hypothetical protein JGK17_05585 [Microcoleus sp. PH2017_10_PVI_O_A]|uniref:hypothetical protein n=1 Tax=unclassified Microcoleus TaxID=2642155 RepID=UPI001DAAF4BD|nr:MULTISPECIES: hypothetical protein [unclassified Microcoleus]TAE85612.1 MAG: hypothetical protein EAZ83_01700 [Oscillatoriales cyanobacterium]MCC3405058.1 hypothetical protein [Microcoleus sp. PH2017_10_PVI_O_A]MCC3459139.1 hypothetical protein [Microcoleus sp. PH2017_11_PCY_U_A]MCC3477196.1 hypothetical protein [Microcoleus sp. PH2017_12_PCY_D_A]MCC3530747.1 hypothetical protein [Microcoleus sp. PH2017_21_RUC_O_A]